MLGLLGVSRAGSGNAKPTRAGNADDEQAPKKKSALWTVADIAGGAIFAGARKEVEAGRARQLILGSAGGPIGGPLLNGAADTAEHIGKNFGVYAGIAALVVGGVVVYVFTRD